MLRTLLYIAAAVILPIGVLLLIRGWPKSIEQLQTAADRQSYCGEFMKTYGIVDAIAPTGYRLTDKALVLDVRLTASWPGTPRIGESLIVGGQLVCDGEDDRRVTSMLEGTRMQRDAFTEFLRLGLRLMFR